jgi:hypothetical protein
MSRLARVLVLAATLAATILAGLTAAQAHPTTTPSRDDARRQALAQERYYSTWSHGDAAAERALAQERYYSTWRIDDTTAPAPAPARPGGRPGWLLPAIGVPAAALALLGLLAAMIARRRSGRVRVRQPA